MGNAIPGQEHIVSLATWFDCDPMWMRYGSPRSTGDPATDQEIASLDLLQDLALLDDRSKREVREMIKILARTMNMAVTKN